MSGIVCNEYKQSLYKKRIGLINGALGRWYFGLGFFGISMKSGDGGAERLGKV